MQLSRLVVRRASTQCAIAARPQPCGWRVGLSPCRQLHSSTRLLSPRDEMDGVGTTGVRGDDKDIKRKSARSPAAKATLRRAVQEAQQARRHVLKQRERRPNSAQDVLRRNVTAYCAAETYDIVRVSRILQDAGHQLDPFDTTLSPHVVHFCYPSATNTETIEDEQGDVFVLPSGTVIAWDVDEEYVKRLVTESLVEAAEGSHADRLEMEDLEYYEDANSESSQMTGDTIILGTRQSAAAAAAQDDEHGGNGSTARQVLQQTQHRTNLVLGKMAFSSGLARSTKVAVLESRLERYFTSTRDIPNVLMSKSKLPYTRQFILRKTGQLLSMRAQLNLSSELTDALPDLFWDSRYELGLEGYFVQVSRALDVGVRIRALNEKMNYAQEIASVLQDRLSEKHGLLLEWLIIALISIEVGFEILRLVKDNFERNDDNSLESLLKRYLEHAERERKP